MDDIEVYNGATQPPALSDDTLISLAEQAEKRIDAMNKIKRIAIKLTNRNDWTDQGGRPYLQVSGAEKIARMFGVSWKLFEPEYQQEEGGHFSYTYKGVFSVAGATIEAIGSRSSKDGFFKKYAYPNGVKTELPVSEIDKGDVKKSAYTNCIGNGITRLLGIRSLTYTDLEEYAGITKETIGKVEYKEKGKPKDEVKTEGSLTVTVEVADVRKREGEKNGKKYTIYTVKTPGGQEYKTFDEKLAKLAKANMEVGAPVAITYKAGKFGNDIETLATAETLPTTEPEDEDPEEGQGGLL